MAFKNKVPTENDQKKLLKRILVFGFLFGFISWGVLVSGFVSQWTGTPGLVQNWQLNALLKKREQTLEQLKGEIDLHLKLRDAFKKDGDVQEAEVRRVLGYVASDELVFDFSP